MFHAIFATSSIPEAVQYYRMLKDMAPHLKVTAVFDPSIDNEGGGSLEKEDGIVEMLEDYNRMYSQDFSMATYDKFRGDVQLRLAHKKPYNYLAADQQINLLIVVNQMLTGFDSKWINTLYLDKVMVYENLIQAFSRTNRLFGEEKPFGTIKYYRMPHTMKRNIDAAVKAYSGDIPTGLFVDKLPGNLRSMNRLFEEIAEVFNGAGIPDFAKLPDEKSVRGKFAKLFKNFVARMEAAQIQGFSWKQNKYSTTNDDGAEEIIVMLIDEPTYLTLLQRYKELSSGGGGGMGGDPPFEIDTHITEINTDAIDAAYMNTQFEKYYKLLQQGSCDPEQLDKMLKALHKSFAMLSQKEQHCADLLIRDIQSGSIEIEAGKSFREYILEYMRMDEDARIERMVKRLGCYAERLRELLNLKVTEYNLNEYGRFDELVDSVDKKKAEAFFIIVIEDYKPYKLRMYSYNYLKDFILSGGEDPYADV